MKLRIGDTVAIISGKDKGKSGTVLKLFPSEQRVVIGGLNMRTRHIKKTSQSAGRIVKFEASMNWSKVMVIDPKSGKPTRVRFELKNGKKVRVGVKSKVEIVPTKPKAVKKTAAAKDTKKSDKADTKTTGETAAEAAEATAGKKSPFWKRMGFGGALEQQAEVPEQSNMQKDHSIPSQEVHVRKGARGS